jgi:hypothetical protein
MTDHDVGRVHLAGDAGPRTDDLRVPDAAFVGLLGEGDENLLVAVDTDDRRRRRA